MFMVALAVGTLAGSSLLFLIPEVSVPNLFPKFPNRDHLRS